MTTRRSPLPRTLCVWLYVWLLPCAVATAQPPTPNPKAAAKAAADSPLQRRSSLQSERAQLTRDLTRLKQQLATAEASRADAADALAATERAVSNATRRSRELAAERSHIETQIDALRQRQRQVGSARTETQQRLHQLLREQHQLPADDPLAARLTGRDPGHSVRDTEYLGYLARATQSTLAELQNRSAELGELEARTRQKQQELLAIEAEETRAREQLLADKAARSKVVQTLGRQIAEQRQSVQKLERDDRRLSQLIEQLSKLLTEQARRQPPRPAVAQPARPLTRPDAATGFAQRQGTLPMPVAGTISAHFGSPRPVDGAGVAPTWKGLFIRAAAGAPVQAVAPGQVVFADWMRGFGNLMVIDHGDGYLSIYGNNESLLRNIGDQVAVGDNIASVGSTGGNADSGLYFELRFQGRPFDPLKWVAAR